MSAPVLDVAVEAPVVQTAQIEVADVDPNGFATIVERDRGLPMVGVTVDWGDADGWIGTFGLRHTHGAWEDVAMPVRMSLTQVSAEIGRRWAFEPNGQGVGAWLDAGAGLHVGVFDPGWWRPVTSPAARVHVGLGAGFGRGAVRPFVELRPSATPRLDWYTGTAQGVEHSVRWTHWPGDASLSLLVGVGRAR